MATKKVEKLTRLTVRLGEKELKELKRVQKIMLKDYKEEVSINALIRDAVLNAFNHLR